MAREKKRPQSIVTERINMIYENSGISSKRAFANSIGVNEMTFGDTLRGSEPRFFILEALLKSNPNISAEWLMRGEGDMYRDGTPSPQVAVATENKTGNIDTVSHAMTKGDDSSALVELLRTQLAQKDEQIRQLLNILSK